MCDVLYVVFFELLEVFAVYYCVFFFFFFKQKTAYEMRISDWSSDVCSSDLAGGVIDIEYIIIRDRDHHGTRKDGQKSRGDAGHQRSLVELPQHQVKADRKSVV